MEKNAETYRCIDLSLQQIEHNRLLLTSVEVDAVLEAESKALADGHALTQDEIDDAIRNAVPSQSHAAKQAAEEPASKRQRTAPEVNTSQLPSECTQWLASIFQSTGLFQFVEYHMDFWTWGGRGTYINQADI